LVSFVYPAFEGVDVVFHTAAADPSKNNLQLHYKVNVEGEYVIISIRRMTIEVEQKGDQIN
jgi:nucleoside-diphosphate-sugar epimerase